MYERKQREYNIQKLNSFQEQKQKQNKRQRRRNLSISKRTSLVKADPKQQKQQKAQQQVIKHQGDTIIEEQDDNSPGVCNFSQATSPLKLHSPSSLRFRSRTLSIQPRTLELSPSLLALEQVPIEKKQIKVKKEKTIDDVVKEFKVAEILQAKQYAFKEKMQFQKNISNWFYQKHKLEFGRLKVYTKKGSKHSNNKASKQPLTKFNSVQNVSQQQEVQANPFKIQLQEITSTKPKRKDKKYFSQSSTNFRKTYQSANEIRSQISSKNSYGYKDQQMYSKLIDQKQKSFNTLFRPTSRQNESTQHSQRQQKQTLPQLNLGVFMGMPSNVNIKKLIQQKSDKKKFASRLQTPDKQFSSLKRFSDTIGKLHFCTPNSPLFPISSYNKQ
eukprot:TRINITY_DN7834_c0_g1_i3.p1 TRINITY_DN7834_c0_g1~~TRINITY_DN7834_c0_g1_i3.p1  ORF type:complete len:385 (+),score=26.71 TRINITY_DN7834_c0_g1_i3:679-1833(+)